MLSRKDTKMVKLKPDRQKAAEIVRDAGGQIVGSVKLQKLAFLLELAGFGEGFRFYYHHYGPFCDELISAIEVAEAFGLVKEEEHQANWGGKYSIYRATAKAGERVLGKRATFAEAAAKIGSIELELAATAAYLKVYENVADPWGETAHRKPDKKSHIEAAKSAYSRLMELPVAKPLPKI